MRIVREEAELEEQVQAAYREAEAAFGKGEVFFEKFLEKARHIEVQIFGDDSGNIVHFFERECSIQRRHQKLVEEAPAPCLNKDVRKRLFEAAINLASSVKYIGPGTVEFLVDGGERKDSPIYFLEMNTRIQVEHPVTEEITGVDLVKLQLQVAAGNVIPFKQKDIRQHGHAIEFRVYGENPQNDFQPTSGEVLYLSRPGGPGIREDSGTEARTVISPYYDSLISKLIVRGNDRFEAIQRAKQALDEFIVDGFETTLPFHRWLLKQKDYLEGQVDTYWLQRNYQAEELYSKMAGPLRTPEKR